MNIALKLCYKSGTQVPPPGSLFFFLFSSILYYLPSISTVHVQIQIDSANTCPISPSLKSLGVVVKAKKHGSVSCRTFNVIVAAFSQIFPCLPLFCSFLILIIFHGMVRNVALNGRPCPLSSALPSRGGVIPRTTPELVLTGFHFFTYQHGPLWKCFPVLKLFNVLGLSPWPNIYIDMGSLIFHPHNNNNR